MVVYDLDAKSHGIGRHGVNKVCIDYSVAYVGLGKNCKNGPSLMTIQGHNKALAILSNIGAGNDSLSTGIKPLPEQLSTHCQ